MNKMPHDAEELKSAPPTGWTTKIEQTLMRSMSFTEFEMTSHPLIFLTVVSTSDIDHVACMNELSSAHHVPSCFSTVHTLDLISSHLHLLVRDNMTQMFIVSTCCFMICPLPLMLTVQLY
jgi:hypothetical protein